MGAYTKYNKISNLKFKKIVYCFACNMGATDASKKTNISVRTVNDVYIRIRENIAKNSLNEIKNLEIDPSEYYFGLKKTNGLIFVILKTNKSRVITKILNDKEIKALSCIFGIEKDLIAKANDIKKKILNNEKIISYYGLVDLEYKVYIPNNSKETNYKEKKINIIQFRQGKKIRSFLIYSRKRLAQTKGISDKAFEPHLRTAEFLFNHPSSLAAYQKILKILKL